MDRKKVPGGSWGICKAFVLALVATLAACGGSGGGDGGSSPPPPPPPASGSLSYPSGTQSFTVRTAVTAINPTITGTLSGFTVSPALPAGLSLDSGKGTISGTPTTLAAAANYTVSAMISGGSSTSAVISIAVNDVPPTQVSYAAPSFTYSSTVAASTQTPTAGGGAVVSWSINPALPDGLTFSTTDGSISGTPTATAASASYVVTAQNSGGQSTVTLTIAVDVAPLINLGHQAAVTVARSTATNVISADNSGQWILWKYSDATLVATGNSGCVVSVALPDGCPLTPAVDISGSTAVIVTPSGFEVRAASDGHTLGSITTSATWWKLATDGSYVVAGNSTSLSAWSPSGQLLFSRAGDYSKAAAFPAPTQILVGAGAAGQSVVETIGVPSGTATTGSQFNGQFKSWFTDGGRFLATAGTTLLIYSNAGVQQGSITSIQPNDTIAGQGEWVWIRPSNGHSLSVYPVTGANPPAAATYSFAATVFPVVSGTNLGLLTAQSSTVSVIDLSGSSPVKTDYTVPVPLAPVEGEPETQIYASATASQLVVGNGQGVLVDAGTPGGTPRYFGFGQAWSIAGGTGHFAVATASGNILYFNSSTLAQEGTIPFTAKKLALSADGSLLVAQGAGDPYGSWAVEVYSLPTGTLQYSWPYTSGTTVALDIVLSGSGTVLGQNIFTAGSFTQQASAPTGGSLVFSNSISASAAPSDQPPIRISPDGSLIAYSQSSSPSGTQQTVGTNLLQNGSLVTAFSGLPAGWLDNSRLVVNDYAFNSHLPALVQYTGCTIYGVNGSPTSDACGLTQELLQFQPVSADAIYVAGTNQIVAVSTGAASWVSGDPVPNGSVYSTWGAAAGSRVVFVSGTSLLAQSH